MTEWSGLWTAGAGDGHPYSQDEISDHIWKVVLGDPAANAGVFPGQLNELAVTSPGNNTVRVASGRALVEGMFYESDGNNDLTVASPSVGTTGKRVVLRKSWSARTVRAVVITSADGTATLPALTQVDGGTWEIPLASFTITTGGVIGALVGERQYLAGIRSRFVIPAGATLPATSPFAPYRPVVTLQNITSETWAGLAAAMPADFLALRRADVLVTTSSTGNYALACDTSYGAPGEDAAANIGAVALAAYALTLKQVRAIDIRSALSALGPGDTIGIKFRRDGAHASDTGTGDVLVLGIILEWS